MCFILYIELYCYIGSWVGVCLLMRACLALNVPAAEKEEWRIFTYYIIRPKTYHRQMPIKLDLATLSCEFVVSTKAKGGVTFEISIFCNI